MPKAMITSCKSPSRNCSGGSSCPLSLSSQVIPRQRKQMLRQSAIQSRKPWPRWLPLDTGQIGYSRLIGAIGTKTLSQQPGGSPGSANTSLLVLLPHRRRSRGQGRRSSLQVQRRNRPTGVARRQTIAALWVASSCLKLREDINQLPHLTKYFSDPMTLVTPGSLG